MPFTLSHPSAALPIWPLVRRGYIPLAPFAIGAMAPDFEYLYRLEPFALISHSARGVLVFCLPVGLATLLLWQLVLRPTARALFALPSRPVALERGVGWWGRALAALLLGSASHVSWDAFTHRDTIGPVLIPALKYTAFTIAGFDIPWYNVLQMASSLLGAWVVGAWLWREIDRRGAGVRSLLAPSRVRTWLALGAAALVVAAWNAPRHGIMTHITRTKLVLGRIAIGAMVGFVLALVALAILQRMGRVQEDDLGSEANA